MNNPAPIDAVRALRDRGVDTAEDLLEHGNPAQILAACHRWDTRTGVGPGLLARWIRDGQFEDPPPAPAMSKAEQLRARFDDYAQRLPIGATAETHAQLQCRRYPEDEEPCPGRLIVIDSLYPSITVECDECEYVAAYPVRALHVLSPPTLREVERTREEDLF